MILLFIRGMARWRFFEGIEVLPKVMNISGFRFSLFKLFFPRRIKSALHAQGLGRHPYETIMQMTTADMKDISVILGDKQFILGNEPSEVDCAVFGFLAQ